MKLKGISSLLILSSVMATSVVWADELDLAVAGDTTLTTFSGVDGVTNSGAERRTLTLALAANETFAGTISGNIQVVMEPTDHARRVTFSGDNTYTGGTVIRKGKLVGQSDNPFGSDHANNPITVEADLTDGRSAATDTSTAVVFDKAGAKTAYQVYGYPINCSEWSNHGARPPMNSNSTGSSTLYNIALSQNYIKLTGAITGGDISIRCGGLFSRWGNNPETRSSPAISGNITALGGTLSLVSRGAEFAISGQVKVGAVYHTIQQDYPTVAKFTHADNMIGYYDCGRHNSAGGVTAGAANALGGAVLISTTKTFTMGTSALQASQNFSFGAYPQIIDHPTIDTVSPRTPAESIGMVNFHNIQCNRTLTMRSTATATNDWRFVGAGVQAALVWDPQGDYALYNVSRDHSQSGTIEVRRGLFAMDENCTFTNVTAVTIGAGAVFSNACSAAGSLKTVDTLTAGAGARIYLHAASLRNGVVAVDLAEGAELVFLDAVAPASFTFTRLTCNGVVFPMGEFTPGVEEGGYTLDQIRNCSRVTVLSAGDRVGTTWTGGGSDTDFHTPANWSSGSVPEFASSMVDATFAEGGARATAKQPVMLNSMLFNAFGDFTFDAENGGNLSLNAGMTALDVDAPLCHYTMAAPLTLLASQEWILGSNSQLRIAAPVSTLSSMIEGVTVKVGAFHPVLMEGHGATDFRGTWAFFNYRPDSAKDRWFYQPNVVATGNEPFGGPNSIVSVSGGIASGTTLNQNVRPQNTGLQSNLVLSNTTISSTISLPHSTSEDRYGTAIVIPRNTTNVLNAALTHPRSFWYGSSSSLTVNGPVTIHPNDCHATLGFVFNGIEEASCKSTELVFNGPVNYLPGTMGPASMETLAYATFRFNAPSNVMDSIGNTTKYFVLRTGADDAFAEGKTKFLFNTRDASVFDLDGHSQHIGSIAYSHANARIESESPATLRINQTTNHVFLGTVSTNILLVKEGPESLTLRNPVGSSLTLKDGILSLGAGTSAESTPVVIFDGGTLNLPADASVYKVYYRDAESTLKPLKSGWYSAGDSSAIGSALTGSGRLRVRSSDIPSGVTIIFR